MDARTDLRHWILLRRAILINSYPPLSPPKMPRNRAILKNRGKPGVSEDFVPRKCRAMPRKRSDLRGKLPRLVPPNLVWGRF